MSYDLLFRRAVDFHQNGEFDKAEMLYRQILETVPENKEKRLAILIHIAKRREQLRHVSENLDRPGAVIVPIR